MRVGVCAIAKDEDRYIAEWMDYHRKLGVDEFFVYENNWRAPSQLKERYGSHFYQFDGEVMQVKAYNHCLACASVPFGLDALAFIDVDEFVCVRDPAAGFKEILERYASLGFPALALNWRLFGSSGLKYDGKENSVLKRFTKCQRTLNRHVKQIVFPGAFKKAGFAPKMYLPHSGNFAAANLEGNVVPGPFNYENLGLEHALELNHYATKTWEETLEKCARGRADCAQKRDPKEFFEAHDFNETENTVAKEFMYGKD